MLGVAFVPAAVISMALVVGGCSAGVGAGGGPSRTTTSAAGSSGKSLPARSGTTEQRVRSQVTRWLGTPHRMGGQGAKGFDCSGFVQMVIYDEFSVRIPRTTDSQWGVGREVARAALRAGDLVFFEPDSYPRHVGIYLSAGEFAHVSTKKGVMVSRLDDPYWARHYSHVRRVLAP